jgi:hypothetical protein
LDVNELPRIPACGLPPKGTSFGAPPKVTSCGAHPGYGVLLHSCWFAFKGLDAAILQCIHGKQQRLNGPRAIRKITKKEIFDFLRIGFCKS